MYTLQEQENCFPPDRVKRFFSHAIVGTEKLLFFGQLYDN